MRIRKGIIGTKSLGTAAGQTKTKTNSIKTKPKIAIFEKKKLYMFALLEKKNLNAYKNPNKKAKESK